VLRLFSMFPAGTPGIALLILRLSVAGGLLYQAPFYALAGNPVLIYIVLSAMSLLLCVGFLTPIVSILACVLELLLLLIEQNSASPFTVLSGLNTVVVALIGPGAYSVDAKLFGRREMTFPPSTETGS
jgi:hypothetical protein